MKRSNLTRKSMPSRAKVALRNVQKSKRSSVREANRERAAFVAEMRLCMRCRKRQAVHCHEFVRGGSRGAAIQNRACWLALCECCHLWIHAENVPLAKQLAWKKLWDVEFYDRLAALAIKRVAPTAVTESEVDTFVKEMGL